MIIPEKWTEIAYEASGEWIPYFGAPLTVEQAQDLHSQGVILMAQRRRPSDFIGVLPPMEIMVKKANPQNKESRKW
jgi:hypothetical protein